jgi:hypothetical protein
MPHEDKRHTDITPETLGGLEAKGLDVWAWCPQCYREKSVSVETLRQCLPESFPVPSVGQRLVCSECGKKGVEARPDWKNW